MSCWMSSSRVHSTLRLDGGRKDRVTKSRHQDLPTSAAKAIWVSSMEKTMSSEKANARKTVIVTGGSQGIGAGLVRTFLDRGYRVVANSRNISRSNGFTPSDRLALVDGNIAEAATGAKIVEVAKR